MMLILLLPASLHLHYYSNLSICESELEKKRGRYVGMLREEERWQDRRRTRGALGGRAGGAGGRPHGGGACGEVFFISKLKIT
jgi:hypothetical protein